MSEVYKQAKKRYRVPDTAHDCPILRIGVVHDQPVSERENLWKVELFSFFHSQFLHHKTTVISIENFFSVMGMGSLTDAGSVVGR